MFTNPVCDQSHLSSLLLGPGCIYSLTFQYFGKYFASDLDKGGIKLYCKEILQASGVISVAILQYQRAELSAQVEWSKAQGWGWGSRWYASITDRIRCDLNVQQWGISGNMDCRIASG